MTKSDRPKDPKSISPDLTEGQQMSLRRSLADFDLTYYQDVLDRLLADSIDPSARTEDVLKDQTLRRNQVRALELEIHRLRTEIEEKAKALLEQSLDAKQKDKNIEELKSTLQTLTQKENLSHLVSRVRTSAHEKLINSEEFRQQFARDSPCPAYVLSIDIRRSTELMLKARDPKLYAKFVITLARQLRDVILENYGVFDKFTGDGILAFFPNFYSGNDAGFLAITAANTCHRVFNDLYHTSKHCFVSILQDIGLGVGIDFGEVQIVQIGGDFTVVGTPVVYACRMGGAEAGQTFVNQPAYEVLFERYSAFCDFEPRDIEIKHEGRTLAYGVKFNGKTFTPRLPEWESADEIPSVTTTELDSGVQVDTVDSH
jgi:Adenylate cyclase, family 3 (some proteins contain HAMP domain)